MNIIIPMAGQGKRMRPHTLTTPKPLIHIAGKPMVQRIVEDILATSNETVEEIAFIIHPSFGKETEALLKTVAADLGATGKIFYQEQPQGTAHAILCAQECLRGNVFIVFADTLFKATFSIDAAKDAIVWTQKIDDPSAFGVVKLSEGNRIEAFVEKPTEWVSDLAIIGVYYFRDGERLKTELQRLLDNDIQTKGEYQLTDAMDHMLKDGVSFYTDQVEEWLDCGNAAATLYTNGRILALKHGQEELQSADASIDASIVIQPCYIGKGVRIAGSVVGPYVSLEEGAVVERSCIRNSIVGHGSHVKNASLDGAMLGRHVSYSEPAKTLSLGDYSTQQ